MAIASVAAMDPFIIQIMEAYDSPIGPDQTATIISAASNLGTIGLLMMLSKPFYI